MKQTAMQSHIKWLYDNQLDFNIPIEVIEDAEDRLEMEKQQMIDAFKESRQAKIFEKDIPPVWETFEQYYNQTYEK